MRKVRKKNPEKRKKRVAGQKPDRAGAAPASFDAGAASLSQSFICTGEKDDRTLSAGFPAHRTGGKLIYYTV